jgi:hypothetical protein
LTLATSREMFTRSAFREFFIAKGTVSFGLFAGLFLLWHDTHFEVDSIFLEPTVKADR